MNQSQNWQSYVVKKYIKDAAPLVKKMISAIGLTIPRQTQLAIDMNLPFAIRGHVLCGDVDLKRCRYDNIGSSFDTHGNILITISRNTLRSFK